MTSIQSTYREAQEKFEEQFKLYQENRNWTHAPIYTAMVAHNKATTIALLRAVIGEAEGMKKEEDVPGYKRRSNTLQSLLNQEHNKALTALITKLNETISGIEDGV